MGSALRKIDAEISVKDYLDGEPLAEERHEYIDGEVIAMAGASEGHEIVALNLASAMLGHMRGKGGRVFKGDMKVRLDLNSHDLFYYPDIMVVCDKNDDHAAYKTEPKLLVEVMTDYKSDHVEKLFAYQQIDSLEEYVIISQDPNDKRAWIYRRVNQWAKEEGAPEGIVTIDSIDFKCSLDELYTME